MADHLESIPIFKQRLVATGRGLFLNAFPSADPTEGGTSPYLNAYHFGEGAARDRALKHLQNRDRRLPSITICPTFVRRLH